MTNNAPDVIKYHLYDLIYQAAKSFVSSYEVINKSIPEELIRLSKSDDVFLKSFAIKTYKDLKTISGLIEGFGELQLEHIKSLIPYYTESLGNISQYDKDQQEEFYLSFSFNIVRDIQNVVEDERKIRKRWEEILYAQPIEVDDKSTSLVLSRNYQ